MIKLLPREEAASRLNMRPKTLDQWRSQGKGPRYVKMGNRVFYPEPGIDEFIVANVVDPAGEEPRAA